MFLVSLPVLALLVAFVALFDAYRAKKSYEAHIRKLEQDLRQLEVLSSKRGNLAHEIAHEIKNPITAILCSAEALDLLVGSSLDPEHRKSLRYIREYGDYLLRLISDFLDISMLEVKAKDAHPQKVKVQPALESISGLLQSAANRKKITIHCEMNQPDLNVYVDPKHLRQVLFNLLHNAVKFTFDGGEISVSARNNFPRPEVKIEVKDNGIGMTEEEVAHAFDPYWHGRERDNVGCGLGLALCKALVELGRGTIHIESQLNVGTCFTVTLPGKGGSEKPRDVLDMDPVEAEVLKPLLGQQYLVVDNEEGTRESVSQLIKAWGGVVDNVSQAIDAVKALGQKDYDAVLIDASLDDGLAAEVAQAAKGDVDGNSPKVFLVTRDPIEHEAALEKKVDKVLEKPFNGKVLLRAFLGPVKQ